MGKILLDPRITGAKINKNIYGHFSEHLGRCVYQGLYVGEDSTIPNVKGMRTDVVEALKKSAYRCCAGPVDALPTSITGRMASAPRRSASAW